MLFDDNTTTAEVIEDIEDIVQDEINVTDHSKLSIEDALEVYKKFNEIQSDYDDMLYEFFEKHDLGPDEYDGDNEPEGPEDNTVYEEPRTHRDLARAKVK